MAKKADDGAGRDSAEEMQQQQQQAHLRQTNKPDPAGSLLSTPPPSRFHQINLGHLKHKVKGRP